MRHFILKNHFFKGVVYKTENVVIQKIQEGRKEDKCYIIGTGSSLSVADNNRIVQHDPCMREFDPMLSKDYTVYAFYFTFGAAGLEEASKDVADFVNNIWFEYDYLKIVLVGHSKAGLCAMMATRDCVCPTTLVTISVPFYGTDMASKEKAESVLRFRPFIFLYRIIFSNHNVDKDITPNARYGKIIPHPVCEKHINVISKIEGVTDCQDLLDLLLLFLNRYMRIGGDGIVPASSQSLTVLHGGNLRQIKIFSSHAHSLTDGLKILEDENLI